VNNILFFVSFTVKQPHHIPVLLYQNFTIFPNDNFPRNPRILRPMRQSPGPVDIIIEVDLRNVWARNHRYYPPLPSTLNTDLLSDTGTKTVTTTSNPRAFPSSLCLKKSAVQTLAAEDLQTEAEIQQACPECGNEKMWFYTLQIRSADEGVGLPFFWIMGERVGLMRGGRCTGDRVLSV